MHDYLVYHAKARTEGINIFQYTRVIIEKIMQYIYIYIYSVDNILEGIYRGCPRVARPVIMILQKIRFVKN